MGSIDEEWGRVGGGVRKRNVVVLSSSSPFSVPCENALPQTPTQAAQAAARKHHHYGIVPCMGFVASRPVSRPLPSYFVLPIHTLSPHHHQCCSTKHHPTQQAKKKSMGKHTILLVQPRERATRTFYDYPSVSEAVDCA
jgi:hypothetical protein